MSGFAVLISVKATSRLIRGDLSKETKERIEREILTDACTLLSVRWNMDMTIIEHSTGLFAYGANHRFTVGEKTLNNALGELAAHLNITKTSASIGPEALIDYRKCKAKWNVQDQVTEGTSTYYGWPEEEQAGTSTSYKRQKTS